MTLRSLLDVVDARLEALRADPRRSPLTVTRSTCTRAKIAPIIAEIPVEGFGRAALLRMRDAIAQLPAHPGGRPTADGRLLSPRTVNGYVGEVRAAWNRARVRELLDHDWPRGIEPLPRGPRKKRPYTDDEIRRLVAWVGEHAPQWLPLLSLLTDTGRRVGALVRLRGRDVDRQASTVTVRDKGQGGQGADVALVPVTRETLALLPEVGPDAWLFPRRGQHGRTGHAYSGSLLSVVRQALEALAIPDRERLDLHSLRRAFCASAERAGVPADVGRRVTGHKTRQMWEHYMAEAVGDDLHAVVDRVRALRFGAPPGVGASPSDLVERARAYLATLPGWAPADVEHALEALRAAIRNDGR